MHQGKTDLAAGDATDYNDTITNPFHSQRVGRTAGDELISEDVIGMDAPTRVHH